VVIAGKATHHQKGMFALGILAIAAIVFGVILAFLPAPPPLLLGGIFVVLAIALVLMASGLDLRPRRGGGTSVGSPDSITKQLTAVSLQAEASGKQVIQLQSEREMLEKKLALLQAERRMYADQCRQITLEINKVANQLVKRVRVPSVVWSRHTYVVELDGTIEYFRETHWTAIERQTLFLEEMGAETPMDWTSLRLNAEIDNHQVAIVPAQDDPTLKKAVLFILPELDAGETTKGTISWHWNRALPHLLEPAGDQWDQRILSAETTPRVEFLFKLHPDFPPMVLVNAGQGGGRKNDAVADRDDRRYRQYGWLVENIDPGTLVGLALRKL
jgi:hypothetical protein